MPLTISLDNSTVAQIALAVAQLTPLEAAATIRALKERPSFRGVNWDIIMAGAVPAAAEPGPAGTGLGVARSAVAIAGQFGTASVVPTIEQLGTQFGLDVSDQGGVSNPAIFDQTSAVNTALDTGILDVTAWRQIHGLWVCSAGTSVVTLFFIDDAGASISLVSPAAAVAGSIVGGAGVTANSVSGTFGGPLPRRIRFTAGAAGVGNTVRLIVSGRR